ncbi:MAG: DNA-binding response OmpR family regulator/nitrogen-specific signal transduction histidine kinase [Saprospiraceae bacterium]|jgi:DNA-binding response OmpR family regulator/nitrogen-specific signal transduction histidine kinase
MMLFGYLWRVRRLMKRQKKLESEVENRTKVITRQTKELQQLDQLKSRFFANVSHELRTPLTLMLGPTNSLRNRSYLPEKDKKLLEYVYKSAKQLLNLVNEILDLSKLESNRLELQESVVNFHNFLAPLVSQFKSYGDSENVHFSFINEVKQPYLISIDTDKFTKIINNFLSNALKFTPKNSKVTLRLIEKNTTFLIGVEDSGSGIHPDDLPSIFNRFFQSKQPDAIIQGGTGIGLSLCKELAEVLNGRVWAASELGKGSTFYFEFPKKEAAVPLPVIENQQPIEKKEEARISTIPFVKSIENTVEKTTILIVEDNRELRSYLKSITEESYEVLTAENGKIALKILAKQPVNFIISDLMMPIMDGFQLLETVKSKDHLRHLPVIMLTARTDAKVKLRALRIGVDDYIVKPFQEEELLTRIANLLRNYRVRTSLTEVVTPALAENTLSISTISDEELQWLQSAEATVLKYLNDYRLNIDFLAEQLTVSRSTFKRKIKQLTGLSANEYLNEIRFDKARELMENLAITSVKAAAGQVGMKDVKYFSKQFKKRFGKSPSDYF